MYTQSKQGNDVIMPFLMGCTNPERIVESKDCGMGNYNSFSQLTDFQMGRMVGTRSLKVSRTAIPGKSPSYTKEDKKNEIDDSKYVQ